MNKLRILLLAIVFLHVNYALAQSKRSITVIEYVQINRNEFEKYPEVHYLLPDPNVKSKNDTLHIFLDTDHKISKNFVDDTSTSGLRKHSYLGEIKNTNLLLIEIVTNNSVEYYAFDKKNSVVNTAKLIGKPVFSGDMRSFVCLDKSGKNIQFAVINKTGFIEITRVCKIKKDFSIVGIRCDKAFSAVIKDSNGKYWRIVPNG